MYVLETIFSNKRSPPTESQCIGAVSLIIWSLILIVSIKYSIFILQADHKGEGRRLSLPLPSSKNDDDDPFRWDLRSLCPVDGQKQSDESTEEVFDQLHLHSLGLVLDRYGLSGKGGKRHERCLVQVTGR